MTQPDDNKTNKSIVIVIVAVCAVVFGLPLLLCVGSFVVIYFVGRSAEATFKEIQLEVEKEQRQSAPELPGDSPEEPAPAATNE